MNRKVIYIAGPMTGLPGLNRDAFNAKAVELEREGYVVLNPAVLPGGLRQDQYMDICLAMVRSANYVMMLDGWTLSDGALAEYALAKKLGHTILDQQHKLLLNCDVINAIVAAA